MNERVGLGGVEAREPVQQVLGELRLILPDGFHDAFGQFVTAVIGVCCLRRNPPQALTPFSSQEGKGDLDRLQGTFLTRLDIFPFGP